MSLRTAVSSIILKDTLLHFCWSQKLRASLWRCSVGKGKAWSVRVSRGGCLSLLHCWLCVGCHLAAILVLQSVVARGGAESQGTPDFHSPGIWVPKVKYSTLGDTPVGWECSLSKLFLHKDSRSPSSASGELAVGELTGHCHKNQRLYL